MFALLVESRMGLCGETSCPYAIINQSDLCDTHVYFKHIQFLSVVNDVYINDKKRNSNNYCT